ncbi:signal recognition particle-docking protein FtsY [Halomonas sp. WWR20]
MATDAVPASQAAPGEERASESPATAGEAHTVDPEALPPVEVEPAPREREAARESLSEPRDANGGQSALEERPVDPAAEALAADATEPEEAEIASASDAVARGELPAERDKSAVLKEAAAEAHQETREQLGETGARADEPLPDVTSTPAAPQEKPKGGWFARIKAGLGKTRANLTEGIADLFLGKKQIDDELMEDLETQLLMADVGIEATTEIIDRLAGRVSRKELDDPQALYKALQEELAGLLEPVSVPLVLPPKGEGPFVILMVGVNGVGKTTTIGKLTKRFQSEGRSVMLAAGDTFRAAAVEQLKVWGDRNRVPVVAQHTGADSASVIYDALAAAKARKIDVLIADTAGRLHNKGPLMEELKKVRRVMAKLDENAPHEVMLVLDAGTGQNALAQASTFNEAIPVTGITLTKLDGTAKGGIIFALAKQLNMPLRYIGVGESLDDLRPFAARDFVKALFERDETADR